MPLPEKDEMFMTKGKMEQEIMAVSYTHLDVYKRQPWKREKPSWKARSMGFCIRRSDRWRRKADF